MGRICVVSFISWEIQHYFRLQFNVKQSSIPKLQLSSVTYIGTWNVCLGLINKKDIVTGILDLNKVDICCLQETEIPNGFPENNLNCGGYKLELETNSSKKRAGIYIKSEMS